MLQIVETYFFSVYSNHIIFSDLAFVVISLHCNLKWIKKLKYILACVCYLPLPVHWTGAL